ncbi:MAG: hypothetical protein V1742_03305, partial [Pseudomonadota bacterium]
MNSVSIPIRTTSPTTGPEKTADQDNRRVLVLLRGALGDVLLALPFLAALPRHFRAEGLGLSGNPAALELLAGLPFV